MRILLSTIPLLLLATANAAELKWNRLYSDDATATSYLQNNWNKYTENYHPNYLLDDNGATGWVEGADGLGVGESATIRVSPLRSAQAVQLKIRNGYHKTKGLFEKNAAVQEVEIALLDNGNAVVHAAKFPLKRTMDWQTIEFPIPGNRGFSAVKLMIVAAYPGSAYQDTVISDVQINVKSEVPYSEKIELGKRDSLKQWVKGRLAQAKYFANLPKTYPFVATQFKSDARQIEEEYQKAFEMSPPPNGLEKDFRPFTDQLASGKFTARTKKYFSDEELATFKKLKETADSRGANFSDEKYKPVASEKITWPDGFDELREDNESLFRAFLDPRAFSLSQTKNDSYVTHKKRGPTDFVNLSTNSAARVKWADKAKQLVGSLYFWNTKVIQERGTYETTEHFLLVFGESNHLKEAYVYDTPVVQSWGDKTHTFHVYKFNRAADQKISDVTWRNGAYTIAEVDDGAIYNRFMQISFRPATVKAE